MIPGKSYTPELVLSIAWRRRWLILIPTMVIAVAAVGITYSLPDRYRSETAILVVPQRVPENYVRSAVTTKIEDRLRTINQQVRSRSRLERIIEDYNLYPERRKKDIMQDIVDDMINAIDVQIAQTDVFRVAFTSDNPRTAMLVTERLATFFVDESLKDRTSLAEGASEFLETQAAESGRKLRETEQKIAEYKKQHDGELPDQVNANQQGLTQATMQLGSLGLSLDRARDLESATVRRISDLTAQVEAAAALPAASIALDSNAPSSKAAQLQAEQARLKQLQVGHQKGYPPLDRAVERVAQLQREVDEERASTAALDPSVPSPPPANTILARRQKDLDDARQDLERIRRDITNMISQQGKLKGQIADYQRRIEAAPIRESELVELTRNYTTLSGQYQNLSSKQLDSQVSANLERRQIGEQFRVIDPARLPEKPSSPDRPRLYMMGLILAIVTGLACAGGAEYLDHGLRSEDDVRLALALPVLATIPVIGAPEKKRWLRRKVVVGSAAAAVISAFIGAAWFALRSLR